MFQVNENEIQTEIQKQLKMMPGQEKIVMDYYQKNPSSTESLRGTIYEDKIIEFTDLAGHEKYLKTTIKGISGCLIDYVAIIINANTGIQLMTHVFKPIFFL